MPVVVVPSFVGSHIWRHHDASAVPKPKPRELEPSKVGCAAFAVLHATGHLGQRGKQVRIGPCGHDIGGVANFDPMHPASAGCQILPFPCQPLNVLLELQKSSRMKDLRLSGRRGVNPWELTLHARSPLATHQVAPGNNQGLARSPLTRPRKKNNECNFGSTPLEPK